MADPVNGNQDQSNGNPDPAKDQGKQPDGNHPGVAELPEYLSSIYTKEEFAQLPEGDRKRISDMGKRLHGDYTKKSQEVAELRRIKDQLESDPDKAKFMQKAMTEYDARKQGLLKDDKASDDVEDYLKDADEKERKAFELLDKRYRKPLEERDKKIADLESKINDLMSGSNLSRSESLEKDISGLPSGYKELADKYKDNILKLGTSRGGKTLSVKRLLQLSASEDEYDRAVLIAGSDKKQVEKVKENATSKPSSTTSAVETAEPSRNKSRDPRFKKGSVNIQQLIGGMMDGIKRGMPS